MRGRELKWLLPAAGLVACNAILGNEELYLVKDGDAGPTPSAGGATGAGASTAAGGVTGAAGGNANAGGRPGPGAGGAPGAGGRASGGTGAGASGGAAAGGRAEADAGAGGDPSGGGGAVGAGGAMEAGGASGAGGGPPTLNLDALRAACLDAINAYRLPLGLIPYGRAPASTEVCSDEGAQRDATTGPTHGSAADCPGMGSQNTCPGWDPGDHAGAEGALRACLEQMWGEGPPPGTVLECVSDPICFAAHGHYINMTSTSSRVVSCGFYLMGDGRVWMNQDFGR